MDRKSDGCVELKSIRRITDDCPNVSRNDNRNASYKSFCDGTSKKTSGFNQHSENLSGNGKQKDVKGLTILKQMVDKKSLKNHASAYALASESPNSTSRFHFFNKKGDLKCPRSQRTTTGFMSKGSKNSKRINTSEGKCKDVKEDKLDAELEDGRQTRKENIKHLDGFNRFSFHEDIPPAPGFFERIGHKYRSSGVSDSSFSGDET